MSVNSQFSKYKAKREYNNIMLIIHCEHNTIGTTFSEDTDKWNIRDMVAECDYILSCYKEDGHIGNDNGFMAGVETSKIAEMMELFITHYKPFINNVKCFCGHCSQYD